MSPRANGSATPRFELPVLDLNFGSITDGTDIPPPPASPKVPTPPQTPPPTNKTSKVDPPRLDVNGVDTSTSSNGNINGNKRTADDVPLSPAISARQGSLRRLFSRNMLNVSYTEGNPNQSESGSRPPSRGASSMLGGRKARRNSWFKLFKSGDSKRSSVVFEESSTPRKPVGPPPPTIPEMKNLEKDQGSLGNDLFKNIK